MTPLSNLNGSRQMRTCAAYIGSHKMKYQLSLLKTTNKIATGAPKDIIAVQ